MRFALISLGLSVIAVLGSLYASPGTAGTSQAPIVARIDDFSPWTVAVDESRNRAYVGQKRAQISIVDLSTNEIIGNETVSAHRHRSIALDPFRGRVYIGTDTREVLMLDADTGELFKTFEVGPFDPVIAVDDESGFAYFAGSPGLEVRDSAGDLQADETSMDYKALALDTLRGRAFLIGQSGTVEDRLVAVKVNEELTISHIGSEPIARVAVNEQSGRVYVAGGGSVTALRGATGAFIAESAPFPDSAQGMVIDSATGCVYVATDSLLSGLGPAEARVHVFSADAQLLATWQLGEGQPKAIDVNPETGRLVVVDSGRAQIVVLETFDRPDLCEAHGQQAIWGDHDCSGSSDPVDSLLTLRHDAGLSAATGDCPPLGSIVDVSEASPHPWGDVDCGGDVTPVDSLKILRSDVGLGIQQGAGCPSIGAEIKVVD